MSQNGSEHFQCIITRVILSHVHWWRSSVQLVVADAVRVLMHFSCSRFPRVAAVLTALLFVFAASADRNVVILFPQLEHLDQAGAPKAEWCSLSHLDGNLCLGAA